MGKKITFKTLTKTNAVTIKQPVIYNELWTTGNRQGSVKKKRQIQYVENLDSIFVDEQKLIDSNPRPTALYLIKGLMTFDEDNITLKDFMEKHPDNQANGGLLFKFLDIEAEELYQISEFEASDSAKESLRNADDTTIMAAAVWFLGNSSLGKRISKLKIALRVKIDQNPKIGQKSNFVTELNSFFKSKNNQEKLIITIALTEDIIRIDSGKIIVWNDSDEAIFSGSQASEVTKDFAVWVKTTDEGMQILKTLTDKVDALEKKTTKK